jgi:hypothetical protein
MRARAFQFSATREAGIAGFFCSEPSGRVDSFVDIDVAEQSRCGKEGDG